MSLNLLSYSVPDELEDAVAAEIERWTTDNKVARVWSKDASVWSGEDEAKWLGWLTIIDEELADIQKYPALRDDIGAGGFTDVLLMGMGGSSLCPEDLAITCNKTNFHILDSTDPAQIKSVESKLDLTKTLFI